MISGTFHISSQEWRYFSREKSIIHTAHMAQLPTGTPGDTVLIGNTAPASTNNNNFSVPPISLPSFPGINVTENVTFSRTTLPDVFGSVGLNKTILAVKNCVIQFAGWDINSRQFYITPNQAGRYFFHIEVQSDNRDAGYLGPPFQGVNQFIMASIDRMPVGFTSTQIIQYVQEIAMSGRFVPPAPYWSNATYSLDNQMRVSADAIAIVPKNNTVVWTGSYLGNAPDAQVCGYMFKIQDLP